MAQQRTPSGRGCKGPSTQGSVRTVVSPWPLCPGSHQAGVGGPEGTGGPLRDPAPCKQGSLPSTCRETPVKGRGAHGCHDLKKKNHLFLMLSWETSVFFPQIPNEHPAIQEVKRCAQCSKRKKEKTVCLSVQSPLTFTHISNFHFNIYTHLFSQAQDRHSASRGRHNQPTHAPTSSFCDGTTHVHGQSALHL